MFLLLSAAASAAPSSSTLDGPDPSQLAKDPRFRIFAYNLLEHIRQWSSLYKLEKPTELPLAIQNSDGEEETVSQIYESFSLDFEEAMIRQNAVDNDFYNLFVDFPEFQEVGDDETSSIIYEALKIVSKEPPTEMEVNKALPPDEGGSYGLTLDEVWDCALHAAGVGVGSLVSIGALKKLAAEDGVQAVVVRMTKFLAKKAGWFGAIVTIIDFSVCINTQMND